MRLRVVKSYSYKHVLLFSLFPLAKVEENKLTVIEMFFLHIFSIRQEDNATWHFVSCQISLFYLLMAYLKTVSVAYSMCFRTAILQVTSYLEIM